MNAPSPVVRVRKWSSPGSTTEMVVGTGPAWSASAPLTFPAASAAVSSRRSPSCAGTLTAKVPSAAAVALDVTGCPVRVVAVVFETRTVALASTEPSLPESRAVGPGSGGSTMIREATGTPGGVTSGPTGPPPPPPPPQAARARTAISPATRAVPRSAGPRLRIPDRSGLPAARLPTGDPQGLRVGIAGWRVNGGIDPGSQSVANGHEAGQLLALQRSSRSEGR